MSHFCHTSFQFHGRIWTNLPWLLVSLCYKPYNQTHSIFVGFTYWLYLILVDEFQLCLIANCTASAQIIPDVYRCSNIGGIFPVGSSWRGPQEFRVPEWSPQWQFWKCREWQWWYAIALFLQGTSYCCANQEVQCRIWVSGVFLSKACRTGSAEYPKRGADGHHHFHLDINLHLVVVQKSNFFRLALMIIYIVPLEKICGPFGTVFLYPSSFISFSCPLWSEVWSNITFCSYTLVA